MENPNEHLFKSNYIPQELLKEIQRLSNRLLIGIPRERDEEERRLALTPEAVGILTDRGHRRLFGIFKSDDIQGHFRFSGFINSIQEAGLVYDDGDVLWYVTEDLKQLFSPENDRYLLERLRGHSAVVCYNDEVACMLHEMLRRSGLSVPPAIRGSCARDSTARPR